LKKPRAIEEKQEGTHAKSKKRWKNSRECEETRAMKNKTGKVVNGDRK
jgi:hypothetical protein